MEWNCVYFWTHSRWIISVQVPLLEQCILNWRSTSVRWQFNDVRSTAEWVFWIRQVCFCYATLKLGTPETAMLCISTPALHNQWYSEHLKIHSWIAIHLWIEHQLIRPREWSQALNSRFLLGSTFVGMESDRSLCSECKRFTKIRPWQSWYCFASNCYHCLVTIWLSPFASPKIFQLAVTNTDSVVLVAFLWLKEVKL